MKSVVLRLTDIAKQTWNSEHDKFVKIMSFQNQRRYKILHYLYIRVSSYEQKLMLNRE